MTPWLDNIQADPAADYGNRRGLDPTVVVIHYTGGGRFSGAVNMLTASGDRFVSAHFVIGTLGETRQLVALDRRAFHAGVSEWCHQGEMAGDVNRYSIGVELVNRGRVYPDPRVAGGFRYKIGRKWLTYQGPDPIAADLIFVGGAVEKVRSYWQPYTEEQLAALERLLEQLPDAVDQPTLDLVGHEEIAMPFGGTAKRQKTDPGAAFPWERFGRPDGTRRTRIEPVAAGDLLP